MARADDRDEGFLGRWARRKQEAQQPVRAREGEALTPPPGGEGQGWGATGWAPGLPERQSGHDKLPIGELGPAPPTPSPQGGGVKDSSPHAVPEMVEPPSLDLVDKDFDLAHWLKQNVPESWKLAALRRAWESDPAIAGYLDPARDYALDWNTPGGAPGYGPLSESDNVEEMLANIFGKPAREETGPAEAAGESLRNDVAAVRPSSNEIEGKVSAAPQQRPETGADAPEPVRVSSVKEAEKSGENVTETGVLREGDSAAAQKSHESRDYSQRARRRGGGATPL